MIKQVRYLHSAKFIQPQKATSHLVTCTLWYLKTRTLYAQRRCHVSASSHQWPTQEPCCVTCLPLHARGDKATFCCSRKLAKYLWNYVQENTTSVFVREAKGKENLRFMEINPTRSSIKKQILPSLSEMSVLQTFEPVYAVIIIYATSEVKVTNCVSIV